MFTTRTSDPRTTRAQVIDAFGGPEHFRSAEVPLAAPGTGEVQIRVAAAAVNPVDLSTRAGIIIADDAARLPMVIGWDAAGTVEAVGAGVANWRIGDRVAAMTVQPGDQNGAYTEHVNLAADLVGGAAAQAALASVRDAGAYITSVPPFQDGTGPFTPERDIRFNIQNVHPDTTVLTRLLVAVAQGELTTSIERTYPLAQAEDAHRRQAQGGLRGKLILLP